MQETTGCAVKDIQLQTVGASVGSNEIMTAACELREIYVRKKTH